MESFSFITGMWMLKEAHFHGARKLTDSRHRWCWATALLSLFVAAILAFLAVLLRFFQSPVMLVKLSSPHLTMFPCVIVCPEIDFPQYKIDAFLDDIVTPPFTNKSSVRDKIQQLAAYFALDQEYHVEHLETIVQVLEYNSVPLEQAVKKLSKNCSDMFIRCSWRNDIVECADLFNLLLTGVGHCCVFNGRSLRREILDPVWNVKNNYTKDLVESYHNTMGPRDGLTFAVEQSQAPYSVDLSYKWVALQVGNSYVDVTANGSALSPRVEHVMGYRDSRLQVFDLGGWGDQLLKCRFSGDSLKYFPIYTWRDCLLECEMELTLRKCGCLRPTHPLVVGHKICPPSALDCTRHVAVSASYSSECGCLPGCDTATGSSVVQYSPLIKEVPTFDDFYSDLDLEQLSIVRVYVMLNHSPSFYRQPLQTSLDLFANVGGIFSVYLGCSVLTVLELFVLIVRCGAGCHF